MDIPTVYGLFFFVALFFAAFLGNMMYKHTMRLEQEERDREAESVSEANRRLLLKDLSKPLLRSELVVPQTISPTTTAGPGGTVDPRNTRGIWQVPTKRYL